MVAGTSPEAAGEALPPPPPPPPPPQAARPNTSAEMQAPLDKDLITILFSLCCCTNANKWMHFGAQDRN
jgi:hypothetical protein